MVTKVEQEIPAPKTNERRKLWKKHCSQLCVMVLTHEIVTLNQRELLSLSVINEETVSFHFSESPTLLCCKNTFDFSYPLYYI